VNALVFVVVALVIWKLRPHQAPSAELRENLTESFISSLRYARNSRRIKIILFRSILFTLVISIVPALLPVIALRELKCSAAELGLVFTSVAIGSLLGAVLALPHLRQRFSANAITLLATAIAALALFGMIFVRHVPALMGCSILAGIAWALAGSEIWVAGQRVMPGWVRGRMNAFLIMLGQGSMAVGALLWGTGVAHIGLGLTLATAACISLMGVALGHQFSINFATDASVEAAPLNHLDKLRIVPEADDGPIRITIDYLIAHEHREEFRILMQEVQSTVRRNGAFQCGLDESLDQPGLFHLEYLVSTWAEHLRQNRRMTIDETQIFNAAWNLHSGDSKPIVRYFISTQKFIHLPGFAFSGRTFADIPSLSSPSLVATRSPSP
jgi:hypothetical protein